MRSMLLACAVAGMFVLSAHSRATVVAAAVRSMAASPVVAVQIPDKKIEITVGDRDARAAWYRSPVWIAIGILAVVVVLLIVVLIARGGGTTIVRG